MYTEISSPLSHCECDEDKSYIFYTLLKLSESAFGNTDSYWMDSMRKETYQFIHHKLLICYYLTKPSGPRARRDSPCWRSTAGERPETPHGLTDRKRAFFPGRLSWANRRLEGRASSTGYIRTRSPPGCARKGPRRMWYVGLDWADRDRKST